MFSGSSFFKILPESPKYLASHPKRWPELRHVLTKMGHDIPADANRHSLTGQLGPWAMGSGSQHYFLTWVYSMGVVFLALALVKRHIEKNTVKAPVGH